MSNMKQMWVLGALCISVESRSLINPPQLLRLLPPQLPRCALQPYPWIHVLSCPVRVCVMNTMCAAYALLSGYQPRPPANMVTMLFGEFHRHASLN
mmetsp:Transcript_29650/g.47861  ORF Transcript_29650/g.47861 Transcript_29650/m.47861 type:complete len:96 (-) Transcript_29650:283-570(-)